MVEFVVLHCSTRRGIERDKVWPAIIVSKREGCRCGQEDRRVLPHERADYGRLLQEQFGDGDGTPLLCIIR